MSFDIFSLLLRPPPQIVIDPDILSKLKTNKSLLLTAHFGNHEYLGMVLRNNGIDLRAFHQKPKSLLFSKLLDSFRRKRQDYAPYSAENTIALLRDLKRQTICFAFLWDQSPSLLSKKVSKGVFMHKPLDLHRLPHIINNINPSVFFASLHFNSKSKEWVFHIEEKPKSKELSEFYHSQLEKKVNNSSSHWYGLFHKRFKRNLPSPYTR